MVDLNTTVETPVDEVAKLQDLRQRVLAGEEVSAEEYNEVLSALRRGRSAAPATKSKSAKSSAPAYSGPKSKAASDLDDLLD